MLGTGHLCECVEQLVEGQVPAEAVYTLQSELDLVKVLLGFMMEALTEDPVLIMF